MHKRTVTAFARRILLITLGILTIISTAYAIGSIVKPSKTENQIPLYNSTHKAQVDYKVIFEPNNYFPETSAGPGRAYILPLTSYIETTIGYRFEGESPADVSGEYRVIATITGYVMKEVQNAQGIDKQRIKAWEKSSEVVPPTPFKAHDQTYATQQMVPVSIKDYYNFVDSLKKEYRMSSVDVVELVVRYQINAQTQTAGGTVQTQLSPTIVIPIGDDTFMVEGNLTDQKPANITQPQMVPVPGAMLKRIIGLAATLFFLLALLAVLKFTEAATSNKSEKLLVNIINKHGNRMVELYTSLPKEQLAAMLQVASFDDLIKLADETGQPILYENSTPRLHNFYVRYGELLYGYQMAVEEKYSAYLSV